MTAAPSSRVKVALFRGTDVFAMLIRLVTRSAINHVGIVFQDGSYYEAIAQGVWRYTPAQAARRLQRAVLQLEVDVPQAELCQRFCERQVGKRYGRLEIVACWLQIVLPKSLNLVFYQADTWICSSLVAAALVEGGLWSKLDPRLQSPNDVLLWLNSGVQPMTKRG